jgi:hypothetical protein
MNPLREGLWRPSVTFTDAECPVFNYALECKVGGNVISRHNEIRDVIADLASRANPSAVRNEPLITTSCPAEKMSELDQPFPSYPQNR